MNIEKQDAGQRELHTRLGEISRSLNVLATAQALSILHPSDQLDKLARRHHELRKAHSDAIDGLQAVSKKLSEKYGEDQSSYDSLLKQFGEGPANEIDAERKRAREEVGIHYRELRAFEGENPHIRVLSQFLSGREA